MSLIKDLNKFELIDIISKNCKTKYGELLVKFMEKYGLIGLYEARVDDLKEFIKAEGILVEESELKK